MSEQETNYDGAHVTTMSYPTVDRRIVVIEKIHGSKDEEEEDKRERVSVYSVATPGKNLKKGERPKHVTDFVFLKNMGVTGPKWLTAVRRNGKIRAPTKRDLLAVYGDEYPDPTKQIEMLLGDGHREKVSYYPPQYVKLYEEEQKRKQSKAEAKRNKEEKSKKAPATKKRKRTTNKTEQEAEPGVPAQPQMSDFEGDPIAYSKAVAEWAQKISDARSPVKNGGSSPAKKPKTTKKIDLESMESDGGL